MSTLYRTQRDRFVLYPSDGLGRDKYIKFNNGGFWKGKEGEVTLKPSYPTFHDFAYHSLGHNAAPFRYYSDGSGRDSYVIDHDGGLIKSFSPMNRTQLKDFLRTPDHYRTNINKKGMRIKTFFVSQDVLKRNDRLRGVEKGIIKRLYTQEKHKFTRNELLNNATSFPKYETESNYKEPLRTVTDLEKLKRRIKKVHRYELNCNTVHNENNTTDNGPLLKKIRISKKKTDS